MTHDHVITIFYNGACPICRTEINHYRTLADRGRDAMAFVDASARTNAECPLAGENLLKRLHVTVGDQVHSGLGAFMVIWDNLPGYRYLARLMRIPIVSRVAENLYDHVLAPLLYGWHRWRCRHLSAPDSDLPTYRLQFCSDAKSDDP